MTLTSLFLAFSMGFWIKTPKLKAMRTGRCGCNPWCVDSPLECPLNTEVWNSFLILSCLSALLPMAESHKVQVLKDIQKDLNAVEHLFNNSDASLYAPDFDDISKCTYKFFDCYLMEMYVILREEIDNNETPNKDQKIGRFQMKIENTLKEYSKYNCSQRYPCEQPHRLTPTKLFFQRMKTFLEKLNTLCDNINSSTTCD